MGHPDQTHCGEVAERSLRAILLEASRLQCASPCRGHLKIHDLWSGEILLAIQATAGSSPFLGVVSQGGSKHRRVDDDHY